MRRGAAPRERPARHAAACLARARARLAGRSGRAGNPRLGCPAPMTDDTSSRRRQLRIGLGYAFGAFTAWGIVLPIYLKALAGVPVLEILAHRVVWGAIFAFV